MAKPLILQVEHLTKSYNGIILEMKKVCPENWLTSMARKVINDGATLSEVFHEVMILAVMSVVFLAIGSRLFSWTK